MSELNPLPGGPTSDERNLAVVAHLAPFIGYFFAIGQLLAPLIIMLTTQSKYVRSQALESLNAQISMTIVAVVCVPLCFILVGFALLALLAVYATVTMILAAVAASKGENYRYPGIIRLVS